MVILDLYGAHCLGNFIMSNNLGHSMDNGNKLKWIIGNWKNQNFWGHLSYQLNSTVNSAYLLRKWAKWAELAVLFSWQLQNFDDFDFFNCHGCRLFISLFLYIVHWVPQFFMHNKSILDGVRHCLLR